MPRSTSSHFMAPRTRAIAGAIAVVLASSGLATAQFEECGTGGPCNESGKTGGCADVECCETVCKFDPVCCEVAWDGLCVELAGELCDAPGCSSAPALELGETAFSTLEATDSINYAGFCDLGPFGDDRVHNPIFFSFVAPQDGFYELSTCNAADYDTRLAVMSTCDPETVIACNDDFDGCAGFSSLLSFTAAEGTAYVIVVGGYDPGSLGTGTLSLGVIEPPTNDDCADAAAIGLGAVSFETLGATTGDVQASLEECASFESSTIFDDVWYSFESGAGGQHLISTCASGYDTRIALWTGDCAEPSLVACNDDSCGTRAELLLDLEPDTTYLVQVGGFAPGPGVGTLEVLVPEASERSPAIGVSFIGGTFTEPDGANDGGRMDRTALFNAGADGSGTLNWNQLAGANDGQAESFVGVVDVATSPLDLFDDTGSATGASCLFAVNNTWRVISFPGSQSDFMRRGYLDTNGFSSIVAFVADVPYETYDVIVYFAADGAGRPGSVRVNDADPIFFLTDAATGPGTTFQPLVEATATSADEAETSSYAVFTGLSGDCEIELFETGPNVGLCGFQIIAAGTSCAPDFDGDGAVSGADLTVLLGAWGSDDPLIDLSGNGIVDGADLTILLGAWGPCP